MIKMGRVKGLILSGGRGTRLRPITHTNAKQLVPVANKPILFYGIEALCSAGINDIGIVVGDTREEIRAAVGNGSLWGVKVTYIHQAEPLGLAHAVKVSKDYIDGSSFVMYLGDNIIRDGISSLVKEFVRNKPNSQILLARVPNPGQFGVAEVKNGRVLHLVEKPRHPKSNLALVGVYMFDHSVFKAVNSIKPSNRGELEITDAIQWLIDHRYRVDTHIVAGWWKDTGKLEDILEANRMMLDTLETKIEGKVDNSSTIEFKVAIGKGTVVKGSTIRGPAVIGKNCKVRSSYIGPFTSVGDHTELENSEVEHSIIMGDSCIIDMKKIEGSLIGKGVKISRPERKPLAYRFMLGDNSTIEVL